MSDKVGQDGKKGCGTRSMFKGFTRVLRGSNRQHGLSIMFGCLSCLADGLCLLVLANNKANKRYRADALQELMGSDKTLKGRVVKRHTQTRQRELC